MSNKELKSLAKTDTTIIYNQASGKLFYNSNGDEKGLGSMAYLQVAGSPDLNALTPMDLMVQLFRAFPGK